MIQTGMGCVGGIPALADSVGDQSQTYAWACVYVERRDRV